MFSDKDALEKYFNKTVTEMTADDLISYIRKYMQVVYEIELAIDPSVPRERSVFKALKKTYGDDAGLIVKWVFWKYKGVYEGRQINYFSFQKSQKWWTDQMYTELQLQLNREKKKSEKTEKVGWTGFANKL